MDNGFNKIVEMGYKFYKNMYELNIIILYADKQGVLQKSVVNLDENLIGYREFFAPRSTQDKIILAECDNDFCELLDKAKAYNTFFTYREKKKFRTDDIIGYKLNTFGISDCIYNFKNVVKMTLIYNKICEIPLKNKSFKELQEIITPSLVVLYDSYKDKVILDDIELLKTYNPRKFRD